MNQASLLTTTTPSSAEFLLRLKQSKFQGDIEDSYGARIVASTDNSVYQVIPEAIIYPRIADDINCLVSLLADYVASNPDKNKQSKLSIVARGGGTGTNGQSLNESLILDTSRYLNNIIELDEEKMKVMVEPGVVLDQLNTFLATHGLFFPPDVSSSSRATLGGMVATDASGKGSRVYGKTSDYIESLDVVLSDGSDFTVEKKPNYKSAEKVGGGKNSVLKERVQQKVHKVISENTKEIEKVFPKMNRGLTGYNLEHVIADDGSFHLAYLLAGSEGTLALTKKITIRVIKKPKYRALVAVLYDDFDKTLEHISHLLKAEPTAIEVLDDKILQIAQQDSIWQDVEASFSGISLTSGIKGSNFIEVTADTEAELEKQCQKLSKIIAKTGEEYGVITHLIETNSKVISSLWNIRKRSVGLLAALEGERRALAFVEDCAVPPENLPAFIKDFRRILDGHGLAYGMYGHADVGCLHVRPTLNMKQETDQKLLRTITDEVAHLAKKYGGLLWGEHGRGYRGEYSPLFFGEQLYPLLREIKAEFDPHNIFNPGKLATPINEPADVSAIDKVPFRGQFDAQISDKQAIEYKSAMLCNGNAACYSWDVSEAMCPSYKATKDKRQSPKGRASMLREWLRLISNVTEQNTATLQPLEAELYESLNTCLSCKSCTHSCPIKVDVPELKSK
ncbi:MAG: FAD-binding oxidoreductase, partial [Kangiellaceae bacterium]|nr:FAD-binding oxidoreductase [Kangiellaceae bacterium]